MDRQMSGAVRVSSGVGARSVVLGFQALRLAVLAVLLAPSVQAADSMRCGGRLVSVEDRAAELRSLCGAPNYRDV